MISTVRLIQQNITKKLTPAASCTLSQNITDRKGKDFSLRSSSQSHFRYKSTQSYQQDDEGVKDVVNFPSSSKLNQGQDEAPVLLNSKEHAIGYLNRILNARVYEAAIETKLQHAKSLSMVRLIIVLYTM